MQKRFISALVLVAYSALLIKVVVFKGLMGLHWSSPMGPPGSPGLALVGRPGLALSETQHPLIRFSPDHANYVPFKTILPQLRGRPRWSTAVMNLVGNTTLFVPVGFLFSLVYRKMTWWKSLALGVAVGLAMEGMEGLFQVGVVDIDDVLLNAMGVMVGYWVFILFERRRRNRAAPARVIESPV